MKMIENGQNKADFSGVCRYQITTYDKESESHGGIERCRNFRNLYLSLPDARPVPVKVDPVQADAGATKWVARFGPKWAAPSGLPLRRLPDCGFPPGDRVGELCFGRRGSMVRRPCHNLVRDSETSGRLSPGLFLPPVCLSTWPS